jgi:5-methylcytosine-specific restriction endonuclease McrA
MSELTLDHIKPRCDGGGHSLENLQLLDLDCHEEKNCMEDIMRKYAILCNYF